MIFKLLILTLLSLNINANHERSSSCKPEGNELKCVKTFNSEMIQELNVCKANSNDLDYQIKLECKIISYKKYKSIKVSLSINTSIDSAVFEWFKNHELRTSNHNTSIRTESVNFTLSNDTQKYEADLTIINIEENIKYNVCYKSNNQLCCQLKYELEEEQSSLYMALLVICVIGIIYIIIVIVFWLCPPDSFRTIDELLATLPAKHVEALTQLVANDVNKNAEEEIIHQIRRKSVRHGTDNVAFEFDDIDEEENVNHKLYLEANKLRRASQLGQNDESHAKNKVRFTDSNSIDTNNTSDALKVKSEDWENLQMKIYKEKRRRDSVHPFKKTYDLTNYESSDSD